MIIYLIYDFTIYDVRLKNDNLSDVRFDDLRLKNDRLKYNRKFGKDVNVCCLFKDMRKMTLRVKVSQSYTEPTSLID